MQNVSFGYNDTPLINGLTLEFGEGALAALVGPNGAGKSTVLRLLNGILSPLNGKVLLNGNDLSEMDRREVGRIMGYVPQETHIDFHFTVREIVAMGRHPYQNTWARETAEDRDVIEKVIADVDCEPLRDREFHTLSGGEKQRVILASALAQEPGVLLLDEPTAALDMYHQIRINEILGALVERDRLTVIHVTHQLNHALTYAHRLVVINGGMVFFDGKPDEFPETDVLENVFRVGGQAIRQDDTGKWYFIPQWTMGDEPDEA